MILLMAAACDVFKNETGRSVASPGMDLAVHSLVAPPSVTQSDTVVITVVVENAGDEDLNNEITLLLMDPRQDIRIGTSTVEDGLAAGDSIEVTYQWDTEGIPAGQYNLQAILEIQDENPANDTTSASITVNEPSESDPSPSENDLAITEVTAPSSATTGEEVQIDVTIENTGSSTVDEDINLTLENRTEDFTIETLTINGLEDGSSTTLTYSWNTSEVSPGEHQLRVMHDYDDENEENNSEFIEITIDEEQQDEEQQDEEQQEDEEEDEGGDEQEDEEQEAEQQENDISISGIDAPSSVNLGQQVEIEITVENTGNQSLDESVNITLEDETDGATIGSRDVSDLEAGANTTLTFNWDTGDASVGDHNLQASHTLNDDNNDNNTGTAIITIRESLAVNSVDPNRMETDATIEVTISGSGFESGVSVSFEDGRGPDPEVSEIAVPDANTITAVVTTKNGGPDDDRIWDIRIVNPDNTSVILENGFTVTESDNDDDDDDDDDDDNDDDDD